MDHVAERAPHGWREAHERQVDSDAKSLRFSPLSDAEEVSSTARKSAWARLLARVYEVDPFIWPRCGSEMVVIAVIQHVIEIKHCHGPRRPSDNHSDLPELHAFKCSRIRALTSGNDSCTSQCPASMKYSE
jgi:hypothetical protein